MDGGAKPIWHEGQIIHEGAEATVIEGIWMGKKAVLKLRRPRSYRHPDLDRRLTRQRLSAESRILSRLSSIGFPSPHLIHLDLKHSSILMTRIDGAPLYDHLKSGDAGAQDLFDLGSLLRRLHEAGISHGDLTTHNAMVSENGIHLIDFGLSRQSPELEHMGLDLQVLNECLRASHSAIKDGIEQVCEGYLNYEQKNSHSEGAEIVIQRFRKITERVRYHG